MRITLDTGEILDITTEELEQIRARTLVSRADLYPDPPEGWSKVHDDFAREGDMLYDPTVRAFQTVPECDAYYFGEDKTRHTFGKHSSRYGLLIRKYLTGSER